VLMEKQILPDPLKHLPSEYYRTEDLRAFMDGCSGWIMNYVRIRLTRDPDVAGDFYIHFYEKAGHCLQAYNSRRDIPFTGFLAVYLRHEFSNFLRTARRREIPILPFDDLTRFVHDDLEPQTGPDALDRLRELPSEFRLPLKLHFGISLTADELRMITIVKGAEEVSDMLKEFADRKRRHLAKSERLLDRAARLNHLLHTAPTPRLSRWKAQIIAALERPRPLFSFAELAQYLGTSKTTIARRIEKAKACIRDGARQEAI